MNRGKYGGAEHDQAVVSCLIFMCARHGRTLIKGEPVIMMVWERRNRSFEEGIVDRI